MRNSLQSPITSKKINAENSEKKVITINNPASRLSVKKCIPKSGARIMLND